MNDLKIGDYIFHSKNDIYQIFELDGIIPAKVNQAEIIYNYKCNYIGSIIDNEIVLNPKEIGILWIEPQDTITKVEQKDINIINKLLTFI